MFNRVLNIFFVLLFFGLAGCQWQKDDYVYYPLHSEITDVQPLTGLVLWHNNSYNRKGMNTLEFSYMLYNKVVRDSGVYDWHVVDSLLDAIAGRGHQAILRFRFVYPGQQTAVPDYIKNRPDYHETVGTSEGLTTYFPDWSCPELKRFTLEFYEKFARRYDNDPRLAYLETGFGLWAEYHIYDGPFELGVTFPSKQFQERFFLHLDSVFQNLYWMISIDAAQSKYSPFKEKPYLKNLRFGLFDDSFMNAGFRGYNRSCWLFFGEDRYKIAPRGGEFSYYTTYDQRHVLDTQGIYGMTWEQMARDWHITFMIANDQPRYQPFERLKQASMAAGYKFVISQFKADAKHTYVTVANIGTAPIYYDTYVYLNGIKSDYNLKNLMPGVSHTIVYNFGYSDADTVPQLEIKCDRLLPGQHIQFLADLR